MGALLEIDESLIAHNATLVIKKAQVDERRVSNDAGQWARFRVGSLRVHKEPEHAIGSGGTQELLPCFETEIEYSPDL